MKQILLIFMIVILPITSYAQSVLAKHYVDDRINSLTYLTFNKDKTFDYQYAYDLMHDRSTGKYILLGDTILLHYDTDTSKTVENILSSQDKTRRADTLLIKKHKLYEVKNGVSLNYVQPIILNRKTDKGFKPPKSWRYRRKYILFGAYQSTDRYYMIDENYAVWANRKWRKQQKSLVE